MKYLTKRTIAEDRDVSTRTVDNWVERGLLDRPLKLGTRPQSRVRWTDDQVAALDARLRGEDQVAALDARLRGEAGQ
ncbi:MAG TPA: hypothetical protein VGC79_08300 [Polyangiaceae bacterium]